MFRFCQSGLHYNVRACPARRQASHGDPSYYRSTSESTGISGLEFLDSDVIHSAEQKDRSRREQFVYSIITNVHSSLPLIFLTTRKFGFQTFALIFDSCNKTNKNVVRTSPPREKNVGRVCSLAE